MPLSPSSPESPADAAAAITAQSRRLTNQPRAARGDGRGAPRQNATIVTRSRRTTEPVSLDAGRLVDVARCGQPGFVSQRERQ